MRRRGRHPPHQPHRTRPHHIVPLLMAGGRSLQTAGNSKQKPPHHHTNNHERVETVWSQENDLVGSIRSATAAVSLTTSGTACKVQQTACWTAMILTIADRLLFLVTVWTRIAFPATVAVLRVWRDLGLQRLAIAQSRLCVRWLTVPEQGCLDGSSHTHLLLHLCAGCSPTPCACHTL